MLKKTSLVLMLAILASGCTREVYLQEVPCLDCQPCQEDPCPEIAIQTEIQFYQIVEPVAVACDPCQAVTPCMQIPCMQTPCVQPAPQRNCRKVCREVPITK